MPMNEGLAGKEGESKPAQSKASFSCVYIGWQRNMWPDERWIFPDQMFWTEGGSSHLKDQLEVGLPTLNDLIKQKFLTGVPTSHFWVLVNSTYSQVESKNSHHNCYASVYNFSLWAPELHSRSINSVSLRAFDFLQLLLSDWNRC